MKHLEGIADEGMINITLLVAFPFFWNWMLLELDENLHAVRPQQFLGEQETIR